MPTMLQVTLRTVDNIPENFVTNQFCVDAEPDTSTEWDNIVAAIKAFYDVISSTVFPSTVSQNGHIVKFYMLPGLTPNYPYHETTFNLGAAPAGTQMPSEVALCLSFQGSRNAGQPQARRRGRVYIGPLESGIMGTTGRPGESLRDLLLVAAEGLWDDLNTALSGDGWAVWSVADQIAVPITNAWVDDSWDTQRSRGLSPSTRSVVEFGP